jgi:hypothetical protein
MTAFLLFVLLQDTVTGQVISQQLRLPTSQAQCHQWEKDEAASLHALRGPNPLRLVTRCDSVEVQAI